VFVAPPPDEEAAGTDPGTGIGKPARLLGPLECTGLKPHFLEKMAANGVVMPPTFFGDPTTFRPNFQSATYGGFE
ncbi:MAG TPA: hypothetical protein VMG74_06030, partial [Gaiellaceae bacterium]|nr:hypothetical protein [Gaiellaceae bacterium]